MENEEHDGENEQRIEEEDRLLRSEERAEKPDVEGRCPRVVVGKIGLARERLLCDHAHIRVGERAESIKLVEAIEKAEEAEDRECNCDIRSASLPEGAAANAFEPEDEENEEHSREQIHSCRQAREQVESQCCGAIEERASDRKSVV